MATIRVKILSTITRRMTSEDTEVYHVVGITSDSCITRIHFSDSAFLSKLDTGRYMVITACRMMPRDELVHVNRNNSAMD